MLLEEAGLAEVTTERLEARAFADVLVGDDVPRSFLAAVDRELRRPYELFAVRQGRESWAVAARRLHSELVALGEGPPATRLEVVVTPEGERSAFADGERVADWVDAEVGTALAELERRGRERFQAFVARADRVGDDRWELTLDPL